MTVKERLRSIVDRLYDGNIAGLARDLAMESPAQYKRLYRAIEEPPVGAKVVPEDILVAMATINIAHTWLVTGEGSMYADPLLASHPTPPTLRSLARDLGAHLERFVYLFSPMSPLIPMVSVVSFLQVGRYIGDGIYALQADGMPAGYVAHLERVDTLVCRIFYENAAYGDTMVTCSAENPGSMTAYDGVSIRILGPVVGWTEA